MPDWNQIAICGVGLIGGSIGMALRQRGLAGEVIGIGRSPDALERARQLGAIDCGTTDPETGVAMAELIVVATPVELIVDRVRELRRFARADALITDAGSTKRAIVDGLDAADSDDRRFVGSHPLAGGHRSGVEASDGDLFVGRRTILTPTERTPPAALDRLCQFWQSLGSITCEMSAAEHDAVVAGVSHVPHLIAAVLAGTTPADCLTWAASGWADSTRIAAGDPDLWREIVRQNADEIDRALDRFGDGFETLRRSIRERDWNRLTELLIEGKRRRDALGS
ncbi:MAG TPA: prephenate dehydrogenase/arogenate dehydrogenase family protein [Pirellulaceae bacterium]|nr:prephenate dehydrogenase/arogenate dehydrogenase family protein [Pirellulaceae bacterium]